MEYTSFLLEPSALNDRFGVSSSVVLAAIGIHYTAAENLPKVPYLTRLDKYMFLCYFLIFASFVENIVAYKINQAMPPGSRETTNTPEGATHRGGQWRCTQLITRRRHAGIRIRSVCLHHYALV